MNSNIPRSLYVDHIMDIIDRGMMIILVGQRRVGKSFILSQVKDSIQKLYQDANVIYINKEFQVFRHLTDATQLYDYVISLLPAEGQNYLLIDEVQDIINYQIALRSLYAENRCQIIATGSNAKIFSSELSTLLGGRYIEIPVYPLSYKEFLTFHRLTDCEESLLKFMKVGGLPGLNLFDIDNERQVNDYLQGIFSTIMMKDIILREEIRNVTFLENLITFIADNIGKLFSIRTVTNTMRSKGEKISDLLTGSYFKYFKNSLLIYPVSRYDIHGKKIFEQIQKFYFSDHGLRNLLDGFNLRGNIEKVMENIIYIQLKISGYKVYVGILRNCEIDFIAEKDSKRIYIQSAYHLSSADTIQREFGYLAAINDNYPKYVVTMDPITGDIPEYPGIHHINLREFLTTI